MPVLRTDLAREHRDLLRGDPLRVHVDDDLQAGLLQLRQAEVGNLDRGALGIRQHDSRLGEYLRRSLARLGEFLSGQHESLPGLKFALDGGADLLVIRSDVRGEAIDYLAAGGDEELLEVPEHLRVLGGVIP